MFETYTDIFNLRGMQYHQAIVEYPDARREEFEHTIQAAQLEDGHVVCDVPSGGCYLKQFIRKSVKLFSVETSSAFVKQSQAQENNIPLLCEDVSHIPLISGTIDRAISLAGSHHLPSKPALYQEVHRLLKPNGIFCLADVREGSGVAEFLNIFVDHHNSAGHKGEFLNSATQAELEAVGFHVTYAEPIRYYWRFSQIDDMIRYCKLLFGIDQATDAQILDGIGYYLGFSANSQECLMNWELYFFQGMK
ncbi:methyltransferase domain-containing protein [Oscillatoria sp. FACHB-1407]|uniref:class I SAM-dependent methyltransferase n=1 Tax=Oscillatoria sp. FACHB-1407 TaxID=2692847 RepID=UPI0016884214|nr:class I SAM-dependent methyltransferase [Oscillatoria sp. FACHB-1407]MBD2464469.1 methyltransferase domain-containing protein [Oscillatoria sp. FACHB-1407]